MEEADEVLPLASSQGGKLFHVIRSSFVDSLEASLKSYHTRLTQVHSSQGFTSHTVLFSSFDSSSEHLELSLSVSYVNLLLPESEGKFTQCM